MERGALHSNLRVAHCWPLFSRSPNAPRSSGEHRRLRRTPPPCSTELLLAKRLRACNYLKERGCLILHKALPRSSIRVFNSCGPQEANINSEAMKDKCLLDCGADQECVLGGIVALGKFDALHIGHRQLAIQASKAGTPFLLSFVGMAEVLGWESRPPIVAKCDRKRVLSSWAPYCGNEVPLEYQVEFSNVRHLTPRQFVERLSKELKVSGVVAGENYRFGYKASGDASDLVRLCKEYGLSAYILSFVMDKTRCYNGTSKSINDRGQVSSTRVRHALAMGDMEYVAELLGRKHRLVLMLDDQCLFMHNRILVSRSCMLNQPPVDGLYENCTLLLDNVFVGPCKVVINDEKIDIEWDGKSNWVQNPVRSGQLLSIEFG
ncbi:FAD synthetase, chloroplastic-like isoform X1 [Phoenix dactylifera]|uniref:FAD synthase n=2 Tax=Phoenix dactylifera TaxID=42345 RepID=A0A8B7CWH1_PHODC|nr:FAD synthetase, chloroplastic-like isoform X1 [Phoenix dactylifera]